MDKINKSIRTVKLVPPPWPSKENIFGYNVGARPYRKGGIRLEVEPIRNKVIYHNYGHGGGGVTLAPGTSAHIVSLFKQRVKEGTKKVAVIGSGYMGLMESILLKDSGYEPTIYSNNFPKKLGVFDGKHCIASQVAGGYWMPYSMDVVNRELHNELARKSFEIYSKYIEEGRYQGLSFKNMYVIDDDNPARSYVPEGLLKIEKVKVDFGTGVLHDAEAFTTIFMDGDILLNELMEEAKRKGVKFVERGFDNLDSLLELEETDIFNCTGGASKALFGDNNLIPNVGHLIYLKTVPGFNYFMSTATKDKKMRVTLYPHKNKIAVGYTSDLKDLPDQLDPEAIKKITKNLEEFLLWRAGVPAPKL